MSYTRDAAATAYYLLALLANTTYYLLLTTDYQVLDYAMQQQRLLPYLAAAYAFHMTGEQ